MDQANGLTVNSSRFNFAGGMRIPEPRIRAKPHCAVAHKEYDDGMNTLLLAAISSSALVNTLIWIVVCGLIAWLAWWFVGFVGLPQPFLKIAQVLIGLFVFIVLVNALMSLAGKPLIAF